MKNFWNFQFFFWGNAKIFKAEREIFYKRDQKNVQVIKFRENILNFKRNAEKTEHYHNLKQIEKN